jgi:MoxR-like ATPase
VPFTSLSPLGASLDGMLGSPVVAPVTITLDRRTTLRVTAVTATEMVAVVDILSEDGTAADTEVFLRADGVGRYTSCEVRVHTADSGVATRLNRLLDGFTIDGATNDGSRSKAPTLRKYWRSTEQAVFARGKVHATPSGFRTVKTAGGHLRWTAGIPASSARPSAHTPSPTVTTAAPTPAAAAPVSPSVTAAAPDPEPSPEAQPTAGRTRVKVMRRTATPEASPSALPKDHPGIFRMLPKGKHAMTVWQSAETRAALDAAHDGFVAGDRTFVVLRGPSGSGKTIAAMDLAARQDLPFWKVDVAGLRDFDAWAGYKVPVTDSDGKMSLEYVPSQFVEAIRMDGPYGGIPRLVLLDEITRVESASALNALLPVLDGTGTLYVTDAQKSIPIDPAVMFVATANMGSAFSGTVTLDPAFVNRSTHTVLVGFAPLASEAKVVADQTGVHSALATALVRGAQQCRAIADRGEVPVPVSTRQLVAAAKAVLRGLEPLPAAMVAFGNTYSDEGGSESHRAKVEVALRGTLGALRAHGEGGILAEPVAEDGSSAHITSTTLDDGSVVTRGTLR